MKKVLAMLLAAAMILALAACGEKAPAAPETPAVPFEVGADTTEYAVDGASGWTVQTVNVKIVAGEDVLYNGTVKLTSDNQFVSEIIYAAIVEKGISQEGVQAGFVTSIGDYVNGNDADGNYVYWAYTVNGKTVPLACNMMRVLEGDYVLWEFVPYVEGEVAEPLPSGIVAPFEVGEDTTEYTVDGASGWTAATVNVKIVAGEEVLYNGTVKLTSDSILASEFTYAAIVEKGISQDGVQAGFITSIGDYVNGNDADGNYVYWAYSVNGKMVPFACNMMPLLDGDYLLWEFTTYVEE